MIIITDFDGTMTKREGSKTVFSDFYQSLLQNRSDDYKQTPLKSSEEIQNLFSQKFGPFTESFDYNQKDADMLISADAVAFFHELLKNDNVSINIVTKNRSDYITEVLKYQGFSKEEINKITIKDSGDKNMDVSTLLRGQNSDSNLYIFDDSRQDFQNMKDAALGSGYKEEQITATNNKPGEFDWSTYLKNALNLLANVEPPAADAAQALSSKEIPSKRKRLDEMILQSFFPVKGNGYNRELYELTIDGNISTYIEEVQKTEFWTNPEQQTNENRDKFSKIKRLIKIEPDCFEKLNQFNLGLIFETIYDVYLLNYDSNLDKFLRNLKNTDLQSLDDYKKTEAYPHKENGYGDDNSDLHNNILDITQPFQLPSSKITRDTLQQEALKNTPLLLAAKTGHHQAALKIINLHKQHQVDVNALDEQQMTALHWACFYRDNELIKELLDAGAEICLLNIDGESPIDLYMASLKDNDDFKSSEPNANNPAFPPSPFICGPTLESFGTRKGLKDIAFHMDKVACHQLGIEIQEINQKVFAFKIKHPNVETTTPNKIFELFNHNYRESFIEARNNKPIDNSLVARLQQQPMETEAETFKRALITKPTPWTKLSELLGQNPEHLANLELHSAPFTPTPVFYLSEHCDNSQECKIFMEQLLLHVDWSIKDELFNNTPLLWAISRGNPVAIKLMIDFLSNNPTNISKLQQPNEGQDSKNTPLLLALKQADEETALTLIPYYDKGHLQSKTFSENSALHLAAFCGFDNVINKILDRAKELGILREIITEKNKMNCSALELYKVNIFQTGAHYFDQYLANYGEEFGKFNFSEKKEGLLKSENKEMVNALNPSLEIAAAEKPVSESKISDNSNSDGEEIITLENPNEVDTAKFTKRSESSTSQMLCGLNSSPPPEKTQLYKPKNFFTRHPILSGALVGIVTGILLFTAGGALILAIGSIGVSTGPAAIVLGALAIIGIGSAAGALGFAGVITAANVSNREKPSENSTHPRSQPVTPSKVFSTVRTQPDPTPSGSDEERTPSNGMSLN